MQAFRSEIPGRTTDFTILARGRVVDETPQALVGGVDTAQQGLEQPVASSIV